MRVRWMEERHTEGTVGHFKGRGRLGMHSLCVDAGTKLDNVYVQSFADVLEKVFYPTCAITRRDDFL